MAEIKKKQKNVEKVPAIERENKILLMGGPNVGKSVFFSKLTGVYVVSSNYTGTTVSFMEGDFKVKDEDYFLIDVPGTYTMRAASDAERVAVSFMESDPKAVIFVLDATNLEGGLRLALELKKYKVPTVYALNLLDVAERKGIHIDVDRLAQMLGGAVIPTVAVKHQGLDELVSSLDKVLKGEASCHFDSVLDEDVHNEASEYGEVYWEQASRIAREVTAEKEEKPSFIDRLGVAMTKPWPGIPIAIIVLLLSLGAVVGGGKALRAVLLLPLVNQVIVPFFKSIFTQILSPGVLQNILIGEYGIFVIGFEWILALIMPYVIIFYVVFSFLEDSGYLPRLAVLSDNLMRKIGVQGGSLISVMLAFGCAVPAIIGTRTATTRKERLMITTMICFSVPCISQMGAIISLTSSYSFGMLLAVVIAAFIIFVVVAKISSMMIPGAVEPLVIEVPHLLMPEKRAYWTKLKVRIKSFLVEAEGPMLIAVVVAAVFKESGLLDYLARALEPVMSGWLGMPKEAVIVLILGIVRREMAVAPLLAMGLNPLQMFVGSVIALLYLPCLSVFGILAKEFNLRVAITITVTTTVSALFVGGLINQIGSLLLGV